ncbi:velvet factor-domain-containing protein [Mycena polygramma]|nr:velvet factor-domain-containing protein [Mycena polygramma]
MSDDPSPWAWVVSQSVCPGALQDLLTLFPLALLLSPFPCDTPRHTTLADDFYGMRRQYELTVRQEPKQARMCGIGGKADRRPIDPPVIVQLRVIDPAAPPPPAPASDSTTSSTSASASNSNSSSNANAPPDEPAADDEPPYTNLAGYAQSFLQNPYYFMFASLAKPDDDTELHWLKDGRTRCTTGSVVSSLYALKDPTAAPPPNANSTSSNSASNSNSNSTGKDAGPTTAPPASDAGFFVFPDLSVRTEGSYRLKLSLFEVVGNDVRHCKSIYSAPFYVYTAKKFPGVEVTNLTHTESSPLTCSLADQGIKIRIRKDIRMRKARVPGLGAPLGATPAAAGSSGPRRARRAGAAGRRRSRCRRWIRIRLMIRTSTARVAPPSAAARTTGVTTRAGRHRWGRPGRRRRSSRRRLGRRFRVGEGLLQFSPPRASSSSSRGCKCPRSSRRPRRLSRPPRRSSRT